MSRPQTLIPLFFIFLGCIGAARINNRWDRSNEELGNDIVESENEAAEHREKRAAPDFSMKIWNRDALPFVIDSRFDEGRKQIIRDNLKTLTDNTCINFMENYDDGTGMKLEFFLETNKSAKCRSWVGDTRSGGKNQKLWLKDGCVKEYTIHHETMHALGFRHTQCRPDRDDYVIVPEELKGVDGYIKLEAGTTDYGIPYEYNSILQYDDLEAIDKDYQSSTGGDHMTFNDWKVVNLHYKCNETCSNPLICENGGYQHPRKCDQCVCPQFFNGTRCELEPDVVTLIEGQTIWFNQSWPHNSELVKITPHYTNFARSPARIIKAPKGTRINVTIVDIRDLHDCVGCGSMTKAVEIVDGDLTNSGKRFHWESSNGHTFVSKTNVIGFVVFARQGLDFSANVTFSVHGSAVEPQAELPSTVTTPATTPQSEEQTTTVAVTEAPVTAPPTTTVPAPETTTAEKIPTAAPEPPTESPVTESAPTTSQDKTTEKAQAATTNPPTESPVTEATQPSTIKPDEPVATTTEDPEGGYWCKNEAV